MNSLEQRDDSVYLRTARQLATALDELLRIDRFSSRTAQLAPWSELTVLDFGFGTARLLAGLEQIDRLPGRYVGVDVQPKLVDWARSALGDLRWCEFDLIEMYHRRYNPGGSTVESTIIPDSHRDIDLVVARSVFTHMTSADIAVSLREFRRIVAANGRVYATVNVRSGVPAWTDNPGQPDAPPLLRVELDKSYFEHIVEDAGFAVSVFVESVENQCAYLLRPA